MQIRPFGELSLKMTNVTLVLSLRHRFQDRTRVRSPHSSASCCRKKILGRSLLLFLIKRQRKPHRGFSHSVCSTTQTDLVVQNRNVPRANNE
jgi:hypothetical protein